MKIISYKKEFVNNETKNFILSHRSERKLKPRKPFGARPFIHFYPTDELEVYMYGVKRKILTDYVQTNHGNAFDGITETMSRNSRIRLLRKTSALELLNQKPSHMLTVTLPTEKFEKLTNNEKILVWKKAKGVFLKELSKMLSRLGKNSYLWFQEFQRRGAPHLHILLDIGKLDKTTWKRYLNRFIVYWKNALEWNETKFPEQSVDFKQMRKRDFRYARKYASKLKQKDAPFRGKWGKWWGAGGTWREIDPNEHLEITLPKNFKKEINEVGKSMNWWTWGMIRSLNPKLYEKVVSWIRRNWSTRSVSETHEERMKAWYVKKEEIHKRVKERKKMLQERWEKKASIRYQAYLKNGKIGKLSYWKEWMEKYPDWMLKEKTTHQLEKMFLRDAQRRKAEKERKKRKRSNYQLKKNKSIDVPLNV